MLALGHLSPDTISPNELATMLFQIKNQLPRSLKLPENPTRRLWKYYKILQCDSALEDDRILVFVTIPLLDSGGKYIVYEIHNLPLPFITDKQPAIRLPKMVAKFKLEHFAIAVNSERTRYIPLTQTETANVWRKFRENIVRYRVPYSQLI